MAEPNDKESKTEEATEKKLRDAIEKGNIPFSKEAATFASLGGILIIVGLFVTGNVMHLRQTLERFIDNPGGWSLANSGDVTELFRAIGLDAAHLLVPVVLILAGAGIVSSILQNPPQLVYDRIEPKLSRISITQGWRRLFSTQALVEFLKALFKFAVVVFVGVLVIRSAQKDVVKAMFMEPGAIPELARSMVMKLIAAMCAATVLDRKSVV